MYNQQIQRRLHQNRLRECQQIAAARLHRPGHDRHGSAARRSALLLSLVTAVAIVAVPGISAVGQAAASAAHQGADAVSAVPLAASPAVATKGSLSGQRFDVFGRGADNRLYQRTYQNGSWTTWTGLPSPPAGVGSTPEALWNPAGTRLDLFVRGANGYLYWKHDTGAGWSDWESRGRVIASAPSAAWTADGTRLDVVAMNVNGDIYQQRFDGTGWYGWYTVNRPTDGVYGNPSVTWTADRLVLHVTGADGQMFERGSTSGTWTRWKELPGGGVLISSPSATWRSPGNRVDLFGVNNSGSVQFLYSSGQRWLGWFDIGRPSVGVNGAPTAAWSGDGARIDVFVGGADGHLYQTFDDGEGWSAWIDLN